MKKAIIEDDDFSNVLPFLLQAQDVMTKLETKIIELETDLSVIHSKYEQDHHDWLLGMNEKDQYIHHLDNKLQKLEFNSKQVIILLSEEMYEKDTTVQLCLNYLRKAHQTSGPFNEDDKTERRFITVNNNNENDIKKYNNNQNISYNNDDDDDYEEEELMEGLDSFSSHLSDLDSVRQGGSHHTLSTCTSITLHHTSVYNYNFNSSSTNHINSYNNNNNKQHQQQYVSHLQQQQQKEQQEQQQQHQKEFISSPSMLPSCTNCKQLLNKLDDQLEEKTYLKRDLNLLASALKEAKHFSSRLIQDTKKMMNQIQDLTSALFTVLNGIWMDQITNREIFIKCLHNNNKNDNNNIKQHHPLLLLDAWDARDVPLGQLKQLLVQLDSIIDDNSTIVHGHLQRSTIPKQEEKGEDLNKDDGIDPFEFSEFQQHLKSSTITTSSTFWKKIISDEIEPCLFFKRSNGWRRTDWLKQKSLLLDAITKNKCDITPHEKKWMKCACCHLERTCEFRLSLPKNNNDDTIIIIDRRCRNRLVAVCDLVQFMTQLKERIKFTTDLDLFKQVLMYRQKIALARISSSL